MEAINVTKYLGETDRKGLGFLLSLSGAVSARYILVLACALHPRDHFQTPVSKVRRQITCPNHERRVLESRYAAQQDSTALQKHPHY